MREQPLAYPLTQAEAIRLMKEHSIGRPSTYSTTLEKLLNRNYIIERRHWLFPTGLGKRVCEYLFKHYRHVVDEERTRLLLEKMDRVEKGLSDYNATLKEIYQEIRAIQ